MKEHGPCGVSDRIDSVSGDAVAVVLVDGGNDVSDVVGFQ